MKVEDLHTLNISSVHGWVDLKIKTSNGAFATSAAIPFGDYLTDFENEDKATEAAALFRASYIMQDVLKSVQGYAEDLPRGICQQIADALALSENTAQTVTP